MVELLGGYCGELTLQSAIKSNADFALIPECQQPLQALADKVKRRLEQQNSVVILCSEATPKNTRPAFRALSTP